MVSPVVPQPTSLSSKSPQQGYASESPELVVATAASDATEQLTFNPVNNPTFEKTSGAPVRDLIPNLGKVEGINRLVEAIGDGTATLLIPLVPKENHLLDISGSSILKFFGIKAKIGFEVKPQTVARLEVKIENGRIVAAEDADGNYKGYGTRVTVEPPLDISPLSVLFDGAAVRDGSPKPSKKEIEAEVIAHALTHPAIKKLASTRLADVMKETMANHNTKERPMLPEGLIDWKNIKIEKVVNVTLKDGVVPLGNASIRLAKGNKLTVKGDYNHATLESEGPLKIESAVINDGISEVKLGKTSVKLRADYQQQPNGFQIKSTLSDIEVVKTARLEHPRSIKDPQPDFLELSNMKLKSGQITTTFGPGAAQGPESRVNISAEAEGEFQGAQLTMQNKKGEAMVHVNRPDGAPPVHFNGTLKTTDNGLDFKGDLTGTEISIDNLQTDNGVAGMNLKKGVFQGNVQLAVPAAGDFSFKMQANQVDVQLGEATPLQTALASNALLAPAAYSGRDDTTDVKLHCIKLQYGQTEAEKKSGRTIDIAIGGDVGMSVDGELRAAVDVRKLKVRDFQLGATQLEGTISHFRAADDARGFEFKTKAKIKNSQIDRIAVNTNGVGITGKGALQGEMDLEIKADYTHVGLKKGSSASLEVEKGGSLGDLRLGSPTTANFIFGDTAYDSKGKTEAGSVKLMRGSFIKAKLEGGSLPLGGDTSVEVENGTVDFYLNDFVTKPGKKPTFDGNLKLHAKVKTSDELRNLPILQSSMVQVTADERLASELVIDASVKMLENGKFQFDKALTTVDARVGKQQGTPRPILGFNPEGVKYAEYVKSKTAAEIAGGQAPQNAFFLGQEQIAALMSDLKLTVKVPIEGTMELPVPIVGKIGPKVHFDPGTQLTVNLTAKNGKLVTSESGVTLSKLGRVGGYFVQFQRAYFDAKNNLCLEVKIGEHTFCFTPGLFKNMPTEIGPLTTWANGLAKAAPKGNDDGVLKVKEAEVRLEGLKFRPGTIKVPGATIEIGPNTHLFLDGKPFATKDRPPSALIYGDIDIKRLDVAQDTFAMKGGQGKGRVRVSWQNGVAWTTLEGLNFRADYSVGKRENGDYAAIKDVVVKDGRAELTMPLNTDNWTIGEPDVVYFELPSPITGHIDGARFTDDEDPKMQDPRVHGPREKGFTAEVGSTDIKGSTLKMSASSVEELKLELGKHDWAVQNLKPEGRNVTLNARANGDSVRVGFFKKKGLKFDATNGNLQIDLKGAFNQGGVDLTDTSTQVEASGNVSFDSEGGLNLVDGDGRIAIQSVVDGTITPNSKQLPAKKSKGSAS